MSATKHILRALNIRARTMTVRKPALDGAIRSFHPSPPARQGLSPEHIQIVKSTAPVLAEHGIAITTHFYKRMLAAHPELRNIFNSAHQSTGTQPAALAHSVWAYAANIDNLPALSAAVSRIGHKHASLGVTPEQYPIVGEHLLASIKEVLGDAATPQILAAWAAAYAQLADIFINFERDLYTQSASTPGGWTGWRPFRVARKVHESDEITSFYLEPVNDNNNNNNGDDASASSKRLPAHKPGQYVSVRLWVDELGVYQPRQYSLSEPADGQHLRISVKRESAPRGSESEKPVGRISNVLHDRVPEGAVVDVAMPYGDFTLDSVDDDGAVAAAAAAAGGKDKGGPVVLISGGVGVTPMLAMLGTLTNGMGNEGREVTFVHAARNGKVHAMKEYLSRVVAEHPRQVSKAVFYEEVDPDVDREGEDFDFRGRVDLERIKEKVLLEGASYYVCGPLPFMKAQKRALEGLGVEGERIHMEVFGSGVV